MIERISLNSLKFFYFVAKCGSVTKAAEYLFVTQSAVSKQIYNLEGALNLKLFERKNKSLILTAQGQILFDCCQRIFNQLDDCLVGLKQHQNKPFILSCEPTFSMKWLIPRLSQFKALGHDFDVILLTGGGRVDFENHQIDLAIRRNDFDWEEHIFSSKIADEFIVAVQSGHQRIIDHLLISKSRPNLFQNLYKHSDLKKILVESTKVELEHFYLCLEGCIAGLGATIMSIYMIEKELQNHVLKKISPLIQDGSAYYLLSNTAFEHDQRKIIFLDWLKQQMKECQSRLLMQ